MKTSSAIDVKAWIDSRSISRYQWFVLGLCALIILFDGYDAAVMGFIAPALMHDWGMAPAQMGVILGAGMFGVALGALIAGPYSDRLGRKRVLLVSVLCFGVFCLLSSFARGPNEMAVLRFLTGLGLGAVMPNCVTLVSEYMPQGRRGLMITLMYCGFNIGSGAGGFVAAALLPVGGWKAVVMLGGLCPLAIIPVLLWMLPESALYMVVRNKSQDKIRHLLQRMGGVFEPATRFVLHTPAIDKKAQVLKLFSNGYAQGTLMLWLTYFMGLFVIYLLNGWLPTIMRTNGFSMEKAAITAGLFQLGGTLGGLLVGTLMDRFQAKKQVIGMAYLLGMSCLLAEGICDFGPYWLAVLVFVSGVCVNGAQTGLQAFSPSFYPTEMRATGVSWMHGIGRSGAIISSSMGGLLLGVFPGTTSIFIVLSIPAFCAAMAIINHRKASPAVTLKGADSDTPLQLNTSTQ
ncbi:aromatic acid/H+ symport family MFS transporter [Pseudomonas sp. dw_358]|uniref:MFS transporter n=1 Tax=Pseudomonas sp. dw_358 TaxID=2720083 RepID=UPI001BD526F2|nr:aromatic acid/H+ symport family MFS transporter [Pseudomonas sp. dw_358]